MNVLKVGPFADSLFSVAVVLAILAPLSEANAELPTSPTPMINKGSGKCAAIKANSLLSGAGTLSVSCGSQASELFNLKSAGSGLYFLENKNSAKCLDVDNASGAEGAVVKQWPCGGGANQRFMIRPTALAGAFEIVATHSMKCLKGGTSLQQVTCSQKSEQRWSFGTAVVTAPTVPAAPTATVPALASRIRSLSSSKCLEIAGGSSADLAPLVQRDCVAAASESFTLRSVSADLYEIVNQQSGKCLDVHDASLNDGATVQQYSCSGGSNQRFKKVAGSVAGTFSLVLAHSSKCLDLKDASGANGAAVVQWSCSGNSNQLWKLDAAGATTPVPAPAPTVTQTPAPVPTATTAPAPVPTVTATPAPVPTSTTTPAPAPVVTGAPSPTEPAQYSGPITITQGGTYSGNWRSPDSDTVAVTVNAGSAPVIIQNCHISGPGRMIVAQGANLTVRNCYFHGKPQTRNGAEMPRAITALGFKNLVVEHNYFEHVSKAVGTDYYSGDGSMNETLIVRYNKVRNIDGRLREGGMYFANFVAVQNFHGSGGNPRYGEIAWNDVQNTPFNSASEDLINFYSAGGRSDSWFKVHNNLLKGSYAPDPAIESSTGSGMIVDGDQTADSNSKTAYIEAYNNVVLNTTNAGMNISAGHDIHYHDNRVISSGRLPDGRCMPGNWAGVAVWNTSSPGSGVNQVMDANVIGWAKCGYSNPYIDRNDISSNEKNSIRNNTFLPNAPITYQMEQAEINLYYQRAQAAGVVFGPVQ